MKKTTYPNMSLSIPAVLAILLLSTGCIPALVLSTPQLQTVEVTREVTREVSLEVTREVPLEVTRLVEIPVTVTPIVTPGSTDEFLQTLAATASPTPAVVRIPTATQCLYGPATVYLNKYTFPATTQLEAIGRSLDGTWINVQTPDHKKICWLMVISVNVESGNVAGLPVVDPVLTPTSVKYPGALQAVSTNRVGNEVTIFWVPVSMSADDYRGYLIEAWVCRAGQQVFAARTQVPEYARNQNNEMQAILFIDEPGCSAPSRARIYAVEKNGYSLPYYMAWPPANPTPTP